MLARCALTGLIVMLPWLGPSQIRQRGRSPPTVRYAGILGAPALIPRAVAAEISLSIRLPFSLSADAHGGTGATRSRPFLPTSLPRSSTYPRCCPPKASATSQRPTPSQDPRRRRPLGWRGCGSMTTVRQRGELRWLLRSSLIPLVAPCQIPFLRSFPAGSLVEEKTGKALNALGATRFDVAVRAMRGEMTRHLDPGEDREDATSGKIAESLVRSMLMWGR